MRKKKRAKRRKMMRRKKMMAETLKWHPEETSMSPSQTMPPYLQIHPMCKEGTEMMIPPAKILTTEEGIEGGRRTRGLALMWALLIPEEQTSREPRCTHLETHNRISLGLETKTMVNL